MNSQRSKQQWRRLETRITFWKKCHDQLKADSSDPESVSKFFLSQSETGSAISPVGAESQLELLDIQERCLMFGIVAHWLSRINPVPMSELESLEKKLWLSRVRKHILTLAMEKESVFNVPQPAGTPEMNTYEVLMKEFSFSNISVLNTETCLSLEGLPGSSKEQEEMNVGSELSQEERSVLAELISNLLDEGSIHEASRVCRYFSLYHPDVRVVLHCRCLASGDLKPEPREEASEPPAMKSLASCKPPPDLHTVH